MVLAKEVIWNAFRYFHNLQQGDTREAGHMDARHCRWLAQMQVLAREFRKHNTVNSSSQDQSLGTHESFHRVQPRIWVYVVTFIIHLRKTGFYQLPSSKQGRLKCVPGLPNIREDLDRGNSYMKYRLSAEPVAIDSIIKLLNAYPWKACNHPSKADYWLHELSCWEYDLILLYNKVLNSYISILMLTTSWVRFKIIQELKQKKKKKKHGF